MSIRVKSSYQIVTEESAREGDYAEAGWDNELGEEFDNVAEVVNHLQNEGVIEPSSSCFHPGVWYSTEAQQDMHSGEWESKDYFIADATEKQQEQIYNKLFPNNGKCRLKK